MAFEPLSQRERPRSDFDGPHEGVPAWLKQSVRAWIKPFLEGQHGAREQTLREMEAVLRMDKPLSWSANYGPVGSTLTRMWEKETFALDVVDFALSKCSPDSPAVRDLSKILLQGGSVWEVRGTVAGDACQLVRRTAGPIVESIEETGSLNDRAHKHLMVAWTKLMGRSPDPSRAYHEAVRAVEVVAAPVVTPDDPKATLGKIIRAINDKPEKWTVDLAEASPSQVADMAAMIWQAQFDRHGNPDEDVPLNVSQEQADAAVHVAIALVRLFAGGHVRPA
jgi:hypothetical protein